VSSTTNVTSESLIAGTDSAEGLSGDLHLFKSLFECSAAGMLVLNTYGRCVLVNQTFCDLVGYTHEEVLARCSADITHADDVAESGQELQRLITGETLRCQIEKRYIHKSGRPVWVLLTATMIPRTHQLHSDLAVGLVQDISKRKAMEEALRQSEKELRRAHEEAELFINSVPSILIGISRDSQIKRWNLAAAKVFGLAKADVAGKQLAECGVQWGRPDIQAEIDSWCASRESRRVEAFPFVINGETRFLGLTLNWISAPEERIDELLIIGSDVTERESLAQQLRQAQKLEAIGQLAAGIAHEINTPTQYVGDNTRFLQESWPSFSELFAITREMRQEISTGPITSQTLQRFDSLAQQADFEYLQAEIPRAIEQSLEGIQRVGKIVRAMKDFSHPGSEEKRSVDLNKAIETTITVAHSEWKYVADVETHFAPDLPLVLCHAGEFNQVILNLLINAAHAIAQAAEDGSQDKGKIVVSTGHSQDWAEISISDTGAGIPEAVRSRVFEPFFTTKPVGKGTGQGLALAHTAIVRRHGGKIWFDSQVGKGTTFYIRMPLAQSPEP
jgi:PAS domain S-box-containing protein